LTYTKYYVNCQDMGALKQLTPKQIKFAQELVYNEGRKTATQCAIEAKYSEDRAHVTASELQNPKMYPLVVQYIGELRQEIQKKYDINFESHLAQLGAMRNKALDAKAWTAAINAEVARGKAAGLYIEQKIIRTGKLDDMSEEELDKRIAEVLDQYSPILEGVAHDEFKDVIRKTKATSNRTLPKSIDIESEEDYSSSSSSSSSSESSESS
jgi:phage terminase small subunit